MDIYMVTLVDDQTGEDQRVLVQDRNPERGWQEWVDTATFEPPLHIGNPRFKHAQKLRVKRPHKTLMPLAHSA